MCHIKQYSALFHHLMVNHSSRLQSKNLNTNRQSQQLHNKQNLKVGQSIFNLRQTKSQVYDLNQGWNITNSLHDQTNMNQLHLTYYVSENTLLSVTDRQYTWTSKSYAKIHLTSMPIITWFLTAVGQDLKTIKLQN